MGAAYVVQRLWAFSPTVLFGAAALTAALAMRVPRERYRAIGKAALTALSTLSTHVYEPQYEALKRFRSALPPFPSWDDLVRDLSRDAALARACLYCLARSRNSPMAARELADSYLLSASARPLSASARCFTGTSASSSRIMVSGSWAHPRT